MISFPSKAIVQVDVPECVIQSPQFVYNYFTSDEGVVLASDSSPYALGDNETLDSLNYFLFNKSNGQQALPRFNTFTVKLSINSTYGSSDITKTKLLPSDIKDIVFEEQISSRISTGLYFQETDAQGFIYSHLSASAVFSGVNLTESSLTESGKVLSEKLNPVTVDEKNQSILDMISNISAEGYELIGPDGGTIETNVLSNISGVRIGSSVSNILLKDIVSNTIEDPFSVFFDEMVATFDVASSRQENARLYSSAGSLSAGDYVFEANPVAVKKLSTNDILKKRSARPVGILIEKSEVSPSGDLKPMNPILIGDLGSRFTTLSKNFIDPQVRYGYTYIYKPRLVYAVQIEGVTSDATSGIENQATLFTILVAGRGSAVSINAEELVPPPPPYNPEFQINDETGKLVITWDFPPNPQRDIKYFQVFRRRSINEPFQLLGMHDFNNSLVRIPLREKVPRKRIIAQKVPLNVFEDSDFDRSKTQIYAITAVDAHGLTSNYSTQFEISFDRFKQRLVKKLVSRSGAPKVYPNFFLNSDTFVDSIKDSNSTRMRIFLDPEYYSVATARDKKVPPSLVIKTSDDFPSYTFDILNTDLQESRTLDIFTYDKIVEAVSGPSLVPSLQASTTGASRNTAGASPASAASSAAVAALAATEAASE
jgi:hypothetical protein